MALDPADRAMYIGYSDGSLQTIDFYDEVQKTTPTDTLRDQTTSHRPIQPSSKTRFGADSQKLGGVLSLSLTWDGTTLISGHSSGKVAVWDVAKGNYLSTLTNLPGPVSNLQCLLPTGYPNQPEPKFRIATVVKPKQDVCGSSNGSSLVPPNYTLTMQFSGRLHTARASATDHTHTTKTVFEEALSHPSFPRDMLEEGLAELERWDPMSQNALSQSAEFMSLDQDDNSGVTNNITHQSEVKHLRKQLASLQRIQKVTFTQLAELREEKDFLVGQEKQRAERARTRAKKRQGPTNGTAAVHAGDVEINDDETAGSESESDDAGAVGA